MNRFVIVLYISAFFVLWGLAGCLSAEKDVYDPAEHSVFVELVCGVKLLGVTWRDNVPWYLTRSFHTGENPEKYVFAESVTHHNPRGFIQIIECR